MTVLTVPEVAEHLKVSTATVYKMVQSGEIDHFRVGKQIRFLPKNVEAVTRKRPRYPYRYSYSKLNT